MPVRAVVQPNGRYARFSTVVDTFTHWNMTEGTASTLFKTESTIAKMERAQEAERVTPGCRWREALAIIQRVRGDEEVKYFETECSKELP